MQLKTRPTVDAFIWVPSVAYPSCLQTTCASLESQELVQIELQKVLMHTSTVPWFDCDPKRSLMSPSVQLSLPKISKIN